MRRIIGTAGIVALIAFGLIQLVPYGRAHSNPPVRAEPPWDSPRTRDLAARACFDCHSNETAWPWYSNIAPVSWQVQGHVDDGREALNFSAWAAGQEGDDAAETIADGSMPPRYYVLTHPAAGLSGAERQELIDGLARTLGSGDEHDNGDENGHRRGETSLR